VRDLEVDLGSRSRPVVFAVDDCRSNADADRAREGDFEEVFVAYRSVLHLGWKGDGDFDLRRLEPCENLTFSGAGGSGSRQ
jgi:hypothetical protein